MEMNLREWLIVLGIVIIAIVIIDSLRRARRARRDSRDIAEGMGANAYDSPVDENLNPELPNSGFRVIRQGEDSSRVAASASANTSDREFLPEDDIQCAEPETRAAPDHPEPISALDEDLPAPLDDGPVFAADRGEFDHHANQAEPEESFGETEKEGFLKKIAKGPVNYGKELRSSFQSKAARQHSREKDKVLEEVIVVNVLAKNEQEFDGGKLQNLVEACGMQLGDMSIYHRHEYDFNKGPVQFSMANVLQPGTFAPELKNTPGVCFFVRLPGPDQSMQAFDYMIETAQCVVRNLGGEMKDEQHSVMTPQTIEHCRQRVREFERRQLSQRV